MDIEGGLVHHFVFSLVLSLLLPHELTFVIYHFICNERGLNTIEDKL